jgi:predicted TIM-barrel fold metal-dependent hydrolase
MIVDAHAHIFGQLHGRIAAGSVTALDYGCVRAGDEVIQMLPPLIEKTAFTSEALVASMDWAGVECAVLLQGPFYGDQNRAVAEAVRQYPGRFVGAAYFDPWESDSRMAFDEVLAGGDFRAVKLECSVATGLCGLHPDARLDAPQIAWLWNEMESLGLVLVADLGTVGSRSYQTEAVRAIAEAHPRLKIVIPHLGQIRPAVVAQPELLRQWQEQIDLGRLPNVWFDCAALAAYLPAEHYPYPTIGHFLRLAMVRIGPGKVMWGSDAPGLLGHATYPQLVGLARLHTQFLTPDEQSRFEGGNALQVFGSTARG